MQGMVWLFFPESFREFFIIRITGKRILYQYFLKYCLFKEYSLEAECLACKEKYFASCLLFVYLLLKKQVNILYVCLFHKFCKRKKSIEVNDR